LKEFRKVASKGTVVANKSSRPAGDATYTVTDNPGRRSSKDDAVTVTVRRGKQVHQYVVKRKSSQL
jgi:hypothetical protein